MMMVDSSKARKQRKALFNAPAHVRRRAVSSHLSGALMKEHRKRSVPVIKGDTVMIVRGDADIVGTEGKVSKVDTKHGRLTVEGVTTTKADGAQTARSVHASKVVITKLDLSDSWRKERLQRGKEG
ncbi:MAG: 50S ribosomal protein L24 [Methanomassiliicoccales archaeon]|nr:50S ribosomal protein L24 [Methanomassiliicoccales archaeon]